MIKRRKKPSGSLELVMNAYAAAVVLRAKELGLGLGLRLGNDGDGCQGRTTQ